MESLFAAIFRFLFHVFVEFLFLGFIKSFKFIGIRCIKIATFSPKSLDELYKDYEKSPTPYLVGLVFVITCIIGYRTFIK